MAITTNFDTAVLALVTDLVTAENIDISKAIYTSTFEVGDIAEGHQIVTGIRPGALIPILDNSPNYASFPVKDANNCVIPSCALDLGFATKAWETAIWRRVWFADSASVDPLLSGADGIFTQAEAMDGFKIVVTENSLGSGLTGAALYDYLTEAYEYASVQPWWNPATARFEMTQAMAAVLVSWLNSLGDKSLYNCECFSPDGVTAQRTFSINGQLRVFGVPVHIHREFDGVINAFALGNPYRAILTNESNILIGTTELDRLPAFDIWYSKDDDQIYIKGGANVGAALVTNQYVYMCVETASPSV